MEAFGRDVEGCWRNANTGKSKKRGKFWREQIERLESWRIAKIMGIDREILILA